MDLSPEERRRIYDEEKARLEQVAPHTTTRKRVAPGQAIVWAICALLASIAVGMVAFQQYRLHELKQALGTAIGKDLGLTETILKIESDSTKMTFAELFDLCNKSVEGRTNLIVELRGLHPEMDYDLKARLIEYLNAENEFVRGKREFYIKVMQASTATTMYVEQVKSPPSSTYGWESFGDRVQQLKGKVLEAGSEMEKSADDFTALYQKMQKEESAMSRSASASGLRFEPIFTKYAAENQKKAKEAKDGAQQLAIALRPAQR